MSDITPEKKNPKAFVITDGAEVQRIYKTTGIMPKSKQKISDGAKPISGMIWEYTYDEKPKEIK